MALGESQYRMEWEAVSGRFVGLFKAPGFTGFAQDFNERFEIILLVGLRQHLIRVSHHYEISLGRNPFEISQTFFRADVIVNMMSIRKCRGKTAARSGSSSIKRQARPITRQTITVHLLR